MVIDACMIMYIVYIMYSILWVFALSVGDFEYLIHILNISFKNLGWPANQKVILHFF